MNTNKVALWAVLFFVSFVSNAQEADKKWLFGFGTNVVDFRDVGFSRNDIMSEFLGLSSDYFSFEDCNAGLSPYVSLTKYFNKRFSLVLEASHNKVKKGESKTIDECSFSQVSLSGQYHFNADKEATGWFDPYVQFGFGNTWINSASAPSYIPAFGFNIRLNEKVAVNLRSTYNALEEVFGGYQQNEVSSYFQHSISLSMRIGSPKDRDGDGILDKVDLCIDIPGLKEFGGCPDTDLDGIVDSEDACPSVYGLLEFEGCPDTDLDGIVDSEDACPETAGELKFKGCPDTDGDGIIDRNDFCLKEFGPASNNGCPIKVAVDTLRPVNFDLGKYYLTPLAKSNLDHNYSIISKSDTQKYRLNGHTDNSGSDRLNSKLSIRRSETVKDYLVAKGFDEDRLEIEGFSYRDPMTTNRTVDGRAQNRRVEFEALRADENLSKEGKIYFRIQVASGKSKIKAVSYNFKGIPNIKRIETGGLYKYYMGEMTSTYKSAKKLLKAVKRKGYPNAFIVEFKEGRKIPISKAVK